MKTIFWLKHFFEWMGGAIDQPPNGITFKSSHWLWGVWWALLLVIINVFCGQSSKFIYIDF
jgi:hypothetical protein